MQSVLYYPFSRCTNPNTLKQLLLVFDSVGFMDPVTDENWRKKLILTGRSERSVHAGYEEISKYMPEFLDSGTIFQIHPDHIRSINSEVTLASAISDLMDSNWAKIADNPTISKTPFDKLKSNDRPYMEIFRSKLPKDFSKVLKEVDLKHHVINEGTMNDSVNFSYAGGSAGLINSYLAVADEKSLALVTDSQHHHKLLLIKANRALANEEPEQIFPVAQTPIQTENTVMLALIKHLFPDELFEKVSFEKILRFRERTEHIRKDFTSSLFPKISAMNYKTSEQRRYIFQEMKTSFENDIRQYEIEISAAKKSIWPDLVDITAQKLPESGIVAIGLDTLGADPFSVLLGAIIKPAFSLFKSSLSIALERKKITKTQSPETIFLSSINKLIK